MKTNLSMLGKSIDASSLHIGHPVASHAQDLRDLWKDAFGDSDEYLDNFFHTAYHPKRCYCLTLHNKVVAALYWFDCTYMDKAIAYIYAVATASNHQGQGFCRALMQETHQHLKDHGYAGAILVPGSPTLFDFYEKIGYQTCTYVDEFSYSNNTLPESNLLTAASRDITSHAPANLSLRSISKDAFAKLRRNFLPKSAVIQENENLDFLEAQADFYAGDDFILACHKQQHFLQGIELLGNTSTIPAILHALHCTKGAFRTCGNTKPFAMFYTFTNDIPLPTYFGLAFD